MTMEVMRTRVVASMIFWGEFEFIAALLALVAVVACTRRAWDDLRTAQWLVRTDPNRARRNACAWFLCSRGLLEAVAAATGLALLIWHPFGWHSPVPSNVPAILLAGIVAHVVLTAIGWWAGSQQHVRVWLDPGLNQSRKLGLWPPRPAGSRNRAGTLRLAATTTFVVVLFFDPLFHIFMLSGYELAAAGVLLCVLIGLLLLSRQAFAATPEQCWSISAALMETDAPSMLQPPRVPPSLIFVLSAVLCLTAPSRAHANDVVDAIAKHDVVRFVQHFQAKTVVETVYLTTDGASERIETRDGRVILQDHPQGTMLVLLPAEKRANPGRRPRHIPSLIDEIERARSENATPERQRLDDRETLVYRFHTRAGEFPMTIWADPETKLPLRIETSQQLWTDFVWDPPIADLDKFFSLEPPPDYATSKVVLDIRSVISPVEEAASFGAFDVRTPEPGRQPRAGRRQLEALIDRRIKTIDRLCRLTETQQQKLRTAGQGDIRRIFVRIEEVRARFQSVAPAEWQAFLDREVPPLRAAVETGPWRDDDSLFMKTLKTTLTPEQLKSYERLK